LEGELARTIRAIDRIQAARVHLVLPERPLFSRETPEPSASIVVRVRGTLEPQQIRAIRHVVASAVSGLKPQRVSIVDEAGQLLADGAAGDVDQAVGDERRAGFEKRMRKQVEDIVSSVVGSGRARVQLSADFDYNKITQTSDKFDPEGRVLRDGSYAKNEKGEMVYKERGKEELDRIAALVRSAIGFDQKRGDQVEVVNLKFADAPAIAPLSEPSGLLGMLQFTKDDVMYVIELGVMMLLGLVVMFMVIRPLVKRILASEEIAAALNGEPALADGGAQAGAPGQVLLPGASATAQLIDVAQVQGQVHAQSVHRV